ncbi:MAG: response regulator [Candidatus Omnitrophota bacterium]
MNLSKYSFLIVDDVRLCRLNVMGILKNLGCQTIHSANTGLEALSILEDKNRPVDCVIADFKMPDMNGLQLLKAIRCGEKNLRRDLPVAMLTGCGDEGLVGLALQLDVNAFILKPASKNNLSARLESIFSDDQQREAWIREIPVYQSIEVNAPVADLLKDDPSSLPPMEKAPISIAPGEAHFRIDSVPENYPLSRDIRSKNGRILYPAGAILTSRHLTRLKGLKDLDFWDGNVWIKAEPPKTDSGQMEASSRGEEANRLSSPSADSSPKISTFARLGKLNSGAVVNCWRCENSFAPSVEILRRHNRSELMALLCPECLARDNDLLCACVKYMIVKGGFPQPVDKFVSAFWERDPAMRPNKEDPFETLRTTYKDDPLTDKDILNWVQKNYFTLNLITKQVECMIDRIMTDPERVRLLGKEGLAAREMAAKRALHQAKS